LKEPWSQRVAAAVAPPGGWERCGRKENTLLKARGSIKNDLKLELVFLMHYTALKKFLFPFTTFLIQCPYQPG
jgi:hypothetical protein